MKQGSIINSSTYNRINQKLYNTSSETDIEITDIRVNEKLPDELFWMDFKEGVKVIDNRFGGTVRYIYKADRTEEERNQIKQEARKNAKQDN